MLSASGRRVTASPDAALELNADAQQAIRWSHAAGLAELEGDLTGSTALLRKAMRLRGVKSEVNCEPPTSQGSQPAISAMFAWEQSGGRPKLVDGELAISCPPSPAPWKRRSERRKALEAERRDLLRRDREWQEVQRFLRHHGFQHVNDVKVTWCGMSRTYPVRTAVKECQWDMVKLLLQFGAQTACRP